MKTIPIAALVCSFVMGSAGLSSAADGRTLAGVACTDPPPVHCAESCTREQIADQGNAVEPKTGRKFFLDYPCNLKPNEPSSSS